MTTDTENEFELPASTHIGRVALGVESLDRVLPFYRDAIGFGVERTHDRAELIAGGRTLLVLEADPDVPARAPDAAGLFHVAVRVPDRNALADALARIRRSEATLTGASDHRVSEALYLRDPVGNGIEIYRDFPRGSWPRTDDGSVGIDSLSLDLDDLAAEATSHSSLPEGTDVGHVHLEVSDLERAEEFYIDTVGFRVRDRYGDEATFAAAGEYHHHVGLNVWNHRTKPATGTCGLRWFEIRLPDRALDTVFRRLRAGGHHPTETEGRVVVSDPDDIRVRFVAESKR